LTTYLVVRCALACGLQYEEVLRWHTYLSCPPVGVTPGATTGFQARLFIITKKPMHSKDF